MRQGWYRQMENLVGQMISEGGEMPTLKDLTAALGSCLLRKELFGATSEWLAHLDEAVTEAKEAVMEEQGLTDPKLGMVLALDLPLGQRAQAALKVLQEL